ncbi:ROK family protein [Dysgonomonas mossii]|uniref:ROK family protein n=1 Tax=Dysgonomonas mossii TaxID=163665 RepID=UPI003993E910
MKDNLLGIDIGGTKCAIVYGKRIGSDLQIVDKTKIETTTVEETIRNIMSEAKRMMARFNLTAQTVRAVGISCGGPLDSKSGTVMSPPNLPGWDNIPIVKIIEEELGVRAGLQNDANACALAEWKFGAGRGTQNMIFLTCGTGLGAGIILNGSLYSGTNDNAGEVGHIRLTDDGPIGYGKEGSFEGYASGGGIAQLARSLAAEEIKKGGLVSWCPSLDDMENINAKLIAEAAGAGDKLALKVYETSATYLGKGLAMLIDILNPELIAIGSIYARNKDMMEPYVLDQISKEALEGARDVCKIVPAALGENIGDYAALSIAANLID